MIYWKCAICGEELEAPESECHMPINCPECMNQVFVPKLSDPAVVAQRGGEHYPGCNGRHINTTTSRDEAEATVDDSIK